MTGGAELGWSIQAVLHVHLLMGKKKGGRERSG